MSEIYNDELIACGGLQEVYIAEVTQINVDPYRRGEQGPPRRPYLAIRRDGSPLCYGPSLRRRTSGEPVPAAALQVNGGKAAFYNCGFVGVQDTLSDLAGRHYYVGCVIDGAIDFIFGYGQTVFQVHTLVCLLYCTHWTFQCASALVQLFIDPTHSLKYEKRRVEHCR